MKRQEARLEQQERGEGMDSRGVLEIHVMDVVGVGRHPGWQGDDNTLP